MKNSKRLVRMLKIWVHFSFILITGNAFIMLFMHKIKLFSEMILVMS